MLTKIFLVIVQTLIKLLFNMNLKLNLIQNYLLSNYRINIQFQKELFTILSIIYLFLFKKYNQLCLFSNKRLIKINKNSIIPIKFTCSEHSCVTCAVMKNQLQRHIIRYCKGATAFMHGTVSCNSIKKREIIKQL